MYLICGGLSVHVTASAEQNLASWMKILFAFQFALSKRSSISSDVSFLCGALLRSTRDLQEAGMRKQNITLNVTRK